MRATPTLRCTEFGDAMSKYYLQFDTMKVIMALPQHSKVSEILSAVAQASEFREVRFRAGEKVLYRELNKNNSIKFPIPVNLDLPPHKVSLVIQTVLGAIDLPTDDQKLVQEYTSAKAVIFQHINRLIRCIVDRQLSLDDAVSTRNALMLARSFGAQAWDDSPLHMKQLEGIGPTFVRKLVNAGISSVEELGDVETHRIEQACSRNPPWGSNLQAKAKTFPKLRITLRMVGAPDTKKPEYVRIKLKADIGFLNDAVPEFFQRRPVYICILAETSDGHKIHFGRTSAKQMSKNQDILFEAKLTDASQTVRAYVMCEDIAGTMRHAMLKPDIPASAFPAPRAQSVIDHQQLTNTVAQVNANRGRSKGKTSKTIKDYDSDEFDDPDLNDTDLVLAEAGGFVDIDEFEKSQMEEPKAKKRKTEDTRRSEQDGEPQRLPNGKWSCNHRCGDKTTCKHLCCREGLDKKPKPSKAKDNKKEADERVSDPKQRQLNMTVAKKTTAFTQSRRSTGDEATSQSTTKHTLKPSAKHGDSKGARDLHSLHNSIQTKTPRVPLLSSIERKIGPGDKADKGKKAAGSQPKFMDRHRSSEDNAEADEVSDYGIDDLPADLPDVSEILGTQQARPLVGSKERHESLDCEFEAYDDLDFDMPDDDDCLEAMHEEDSGGHIAQSPIEDNYILDNGASIWDVDSSPRKRARPTSTGHDLFISSESPQKLPAVEQHDPNTTMVSGSSFHANTAGGEDGTRAAQPPAKHEHEDLVKWFRANFDEDASLFNIVDSMESGTCG